MINVQITTDASVVALRRTSMTTAPSLWCYRVGASPSSKTSVWRTTGQDRAIAHPGRLGWSQVDEAMRCVVNHYQESGAADPALVIVQVGDEPDDRAAVRTLLQNSAMLGVCWIFIGFGRGKMAFYKNLNSSTSATFHNVAFYNTGKNPGAVPGEQFYAELVRGFSTWSRAQG
ncbi:VWA domain-containing protein [Nocardia abscessus]|uniref:VWA domain-containing protein n=1 Tax=Nocardia abscessus TaxID=120957 RepID=UPI0024543D96|nr:VWA domain-containing protein [Nocardia abscessus]